MAPEPAIPGGDHPHRRSAKPRRAPDAERHARWPSGLQFAYDVLRDPVLFRHALVGFWTLIAAVVILAAVAVGLGYLVSVHGPLWVKGVITVGSTSIVTGGGAAFGRYQARRRKSGPGRRKPPGRLPGKGTAPASGLPRESPQEAKGGFGEPGED